MYSLNSGQSKIRNVVVSGGTHGNEFTGAFLIRQWLKDPSPLQRDGFATHSIFGNPEAFKVCRRYVERDLNRSFHPSGPVVHPEALELERAREIEKWIHSRCDGSPDVIFDLHSTTANMGLSLVLTSREPFNILLLAYLRSLFPEVNAYLWEEQTQNPGFMNSLASKGFAIEVGPVANGVLDAAWVLKTSALVHACLNFIVHWNQSDVLQLPSQVPLYSYLRHIDYPRAEDSLPAAMIHPKFQNMDFQLLKEGDPIFLGFDETVLSWKGEPVWPVFINEAAYYEKGIAFTATQKIEIRTEDIAAK